MNDEREFVSLDFEFSTHHSSLFTLHHPRIVVADRIDPLRDRVGGHQLGRVGAENVQPDGRLGGVVQPDGLVFGRRMAGMRLWIGSSSSLG